MKIKSDSLIKKRALEYSKKPRKQKSNLVNSIIKKKIK